MFIKTTVGLVVVFMFSSILFADNRKIYFEDELHQRHILKQIAISSKASVSQRFAAEELAKYLKQITGIKLPIVEDVKVGAEDGTIFVGYNAVPERSAFEMITSRRTRGKLGETWKNTFFRRRLIEIEALKQDGFVLRTMGRSIVIAGKGPRGDLYGVYTLLEKLGCRWFTASEEYVPHKADLIIPYLWESQEPSFERRCIAAKGSGKAVSWYVKMKLNSPYSSTTNIKPFLGKYGGVYWRWEVGGHSFLALVPPKKYFETHPEYYALVKDKKTGKLVRKPVQLCVSNPDLPDIMAKAIIEYFDKHPGVNVYPLSSADNDYVCQCEHCKKLYPCSSDRTFYLINKVVEKVLRKYPDKRFVSFAYGPSWYPPVTIKPHPRVTIEFCSHWPACQIHSFADLNCTMNTRVRSYFAGWRKLTDNIHAYCYGSDFTFLIFPLSLEKAITGNTLWYYKQHIKGIKWQIERIPECQQTDPIAFYLIAKLAWDATADPKFIINDFIEHYYGPAAKPMKKYYRLLNSRADMGTDMCIIAYRPPYAGLLNKEMVKQANAILDKAERLACTDKDFLRRVNMQRLRILALDLFIKPNKSSLERFERIVNKYNLWNWTLSEWKRMKWYSMSGFIAVCKEKIAK